LFTECEIAQQHDGAGADQHPAGDSWAVRIDVVFDAEPKDGAITT